MQILVLLLEWVLQPVLISRLPQQKHYQCLGCLACTRLQELQPHTGCSQTFMLLNVTHVSNFTAVSHPLACIHMFLSTLEGKRFHSPE